MEVNYKQRLDLSATVLHDPKLVSLVEGSPGPELLYSCCEIMDTATKHRMVCYIINYFSVQIVQKKKKLQLH